MHVYILLRHCEGSASRCTDGCVGWMAIYLYVSATSAITLVVSTKADRLERLHVVYVLALSWRGVCTVSHTVWRYLFGVSSQWLLARQISPHVCTVWYCKNSPSIYTFTYAFMWYYCHAPYMNYFSCSTPEFEYLRQGKINWAICEKQPNQFYFKGLCL